MPSELTKLSPLHDRAITLMMAGKSNGVIAKACGVDSTTVSKWRGDPLVKLELVRLRDLAFYEARAILEAAAIPAARTLAAVVDVGNERKVTPTERITATAIVTMLGITAAAPPDIDGDGDMTPAEALAKLSELPEAVLERALRVKRAKAKESSNE